MRKLLALLGFTLFTMSIGAPAFAADAMFLLPKALTTTTQTSVSITTGNTFQVALAANPLRKQCILQNNSTTDQLFIFFGTGTASKPKSIILPVATASVIPTFNCNTNSSDSGVVVDQIQITQATTADAVTVVEQQ